MMRELERRMTAPGFVGSTFVSGEKSYVVALADDFSYMDPVDRSEMLAPLIDVALRISDLNKYTGRDKPTVIT
ncbi:unnamed protein product [Leptidea sinapis]|uniref:Uncharacterized protein n=1 Tax=Leptidea sinapis TaxID=189913 RepID=A0A5E4QF88_9NEOP|nr:unnamed protein product [Leptidea sinapis]